MNVSTKSIALTLAAAAGLSGIGSITAPTAQAVTRCDSGTLLGRYTLKSKLNHKFVRAGIGADSYVGARSNTIGGSSSWETFDIYDLGNRNGLNGGTYALRSTQDPSRWVGVNSQNALKLMGGCITSTTSRLFRANKVGNVVQLQSLRNGQWVIQRSDNMLYANAAAPGGNVPQALQFRMRRIGSGPSTPPAQQQSSYNLSGTWRGNDGATYTIRQSGNIISWTGRGGNFRNMFIGERQGNIVSGFWQDTAYSQTQNAGKLVFRVVDGSTLRKVGSTGAFGGTTWSR